MSGTGLVPPLCPQMSAFLCCGTLDMLSSKLHTAVVPPPAAHYQHACQVHNTGRVLGIVRAVNSQVQDDLFLSWSPTESVTAADSETVADTPDKHHQQALRQSRRGQRQLQAGPDNAPTSPPSPSSKPPPSQQQQRTCKQRTRTASSSSPDSFTRKLAPAASQPHRPYKGSMGRHTAHAAAAGSAADPYWEAQQRVRALLAAADPHNPAAAAAQLPDTVNDLTIALQLLATTPRPATSAAHRQYDAAVQQLAGAVVQKYKQLLLRLLPPPHAARSQSAANMRQQREPQQQRQLEPNSLQDQQQQQLARALASVPPTKLAATAFSLGVLRMYDRQLVGALEDASLLLLRRNAFKANQLGQIIQGFVYLDHLPNPEWHAGFLAATRRHLDSMQGPQLASIAAWLMSYALAGTGTGPTNSSSSSSRGLHCGGKGILGVPGERGGVGAGAAGMFLAPATAAGTNSNTPAMQPDSRWVHAYLAAVGRQAGSLKPLQLVQVLQATVGLWQQLQAGDASGAGRGPQELVLFGQGSSVLHAVGMGKAPGEHAAAQGVGAAPERQQSATQQAHAAAAGDGRHGNAHSDNSPPHPIRRQQLQQQQEHGRYGTQDGSSSGQHSSWAASLVAAVQQQLPELTMAHLAAALPALLMLTQHPWPPHLLARVLLQIKVQLPASAGKDLVTVVQAAAMLAGPDALAAEQEWCDAVLLQLHAQLPTLSPAKLAGAVNAVALLQVRPYKAWVYALCQRLRVDARVLDAEQTLVILEGLAAVGIQLDPEVLHAFALQIERFMGAWDGSELGRVAQALKKMYPKVLPGRSIQQLVGELQRRQQFLALQEQRQKVSMFGM